MAGLKYMRHPQDLLETVREQRTPLLDEGLNSQVFRVADYVLKVSRFRGSYGQAEKLADNLVDDQARTEEFLGAYIPATRIDIVKDGPKNRDFRVGIVQPFAEGGRLAPFLKNPRTDKAPLIHFLISSLEMFEETGVMPDIAHVERRFFHFGNTPNLIMDDQSGEPTLVDTTRGRLQRAPGVGRLWSLAIAVRSREALIRLGQAHPEEKLRFPSVF